MDFRSHSRIYHYTSALPCSQSLPQPRGPLLADYRNPSSLPAGLLNNPNIHSTAESDFTTVLNTSGSNISYSRLLEQEKASKSVGGRHTCILSSRNGNLGQCLYHSTCHLSMFRPNVSFFLYGLPPSQLRYRAGHTAPGSMHHAAGPIYSLSSPGDTCPVVYAGTSGRVHEIDITETKIKFSGPGERYVQPQDQYFTNLSKRGWDVTWGSRREDLTMMETDDGCGKAIQEYEDVKMVLWRQDLGEGGKGSRIVVEDKESNGRKAPTKEISWRLDRTWLEVGGAN
jgi:hypothetical protein